MKCVTVIAFLLFLAPSAAVAHGDEDHGAAAPAVTRAVAPRASASSEEFEVVAVYANGQLTLYLDHFASNAPVAGATVEIEGDGLKGVATETAPGVYAIDAAAMTPARHPLTIAIEAGDSADLLAVVLDLAPAQAGAGHAAAAQAQDGAAWRTWLAAAGMLGVLAAALMLWRRRHAGAHEGDR